MDKPFKLMPDIDILPSHFTVPGAGELAVNAFVIRAQEPVLVDTGMAIDSDGFMAALESVIDLRDLKWIWLTHDDVDHTGSLQKVLAAAPNARLATFSLAALRMSTTWPVPMDRVYWLNPGDSISAGDRKLTALRPPLYDNPTTIALFDNKSEVLFSADCFGAIIPSPVQNADDIAEDILAQGMAGWAKLDSPWVHMIRPADFKQTLDVIERLDPKMILSAHLPPASAKTRQFLDIFATLPASAPALAPNQAALEQMLAQGAPQG